MATYPPRNLARRMYSHIPYSEAVVYPILIHEIPYTIYGVCRAVSIIVLHSPPPQTLSMRKINMLEHALLHWRSRLRSKPQQLVKPVTLRKRRQVIKSEANWPLFYYQWVLWVWVGRYLLEIIASWLRRYIPIAVFVFALYYRQVSWRDQYWNWANGRVWLPFLGYPPWHTPFMTYGEACARDRG